MLVNRRSLHRSRVSICLVKSDGGKSGQSCGRIMMVVCSIFVEKLFKQHVSLINSLTFQLLLLPQLGVFVERAEILFPAALKSPVDSTPSSSYPFEVFFYWRTLILGSCGSIFLHLELTAGVSLPQMQIPGSILYIHDQRDDAGVIIAPSITGEKQRRGAGEKVEMIFKRL